MKKILMMASIISAVTLQAQTETFDIASFIAPKGWQRVDSNGVVAFFNSKTNNGLTSFCQIFLFPSRDANDDASKNFQDEWTVRIMRSTGAKSIPQTQTDKTTDGWTAVSGRADISQNGITYTCMLSAITGHGKEMSVVVNVAGQEYVNEVQVFFEHLDLRAPVITGNVWNGNDTAPDKNSTVQGNYVYTVPAGWMPKLYGDGGVVITSPVYGTGERCTISVLPMRPATVDLQTAANGMFSGLFGKRLPGCHYIHITFDDPRIFSTGMGILYHKTRHQTTHGKFLRRLCICFCCQVGKPGSSYNRNIKRSVSE